MINKHSNLYDIDGKLINGAPLQDMSIEQVEKLLDEYAEKFKSFPDNRVYEVYVNNLYRWLMYLYQVHGNPHEKELLQKINNTEITDALNEVNKDVEQARSEESSAIGGIEPVETNEDKPESTVGTENN